MFLSPTLAGGFFTTNANIVLFIYPDPQIAVVLAIGSSINWHFFSYFSFEYSLTSLTQDGPGLSCIFSAQP